MDPKTKGAWLLSQSKILDGVAGPAAARLENISFAGKIGRFYNLLRRNVEGEMSPTISPETIETSCKLNGIDRASRNEGLRLLKGAGRIDVAQNGAVSVLGSSVTAVLETASAVFDDTNPSADELATLSLSEAVADRPKTRSAAEEQISDEFKIPEKKVADLIELCRDTGLLDEERDRGRVILFNSNTFRDSQYAAKAYRALEGLNTTEQKNLQEVQERLRKEGALLDEDVRKILGTDLHKRLLSVGLFDRLEVSNNTESVGYMTSPADFQRFGRPFEEDPIDDAKALLASLTYGQTRSYYERGSITMPVALLNALIAGREIGKQGIRAIGEDYKELERRQVVKVTRRGYNRFTMKLLKKDVGELALTIIRGARPAEAALLMDGAPAVNFNGPDITRRKVRQRNTPADRGFVADSLDRLRMGL